MREAGADALDPAGVLALGRRQRDAAGHDHTGKARHRSQRDHGGGQALVARRDADDAPPPGEAADEPAHHHRGVVAVSEAVKHRLGPLAAAVAGVAHVSGKGDVPHRAQAIGALLDQKADFPVACVIAQGDGRAVGRPHAAHGAHDEKLLAGDGGRIPSHPHALAQAKKVAAGRVEEHFGGKGKPTLGAGSVGDHLIHFGVTRVK